MKNQEETTLRELLAMFCADIDIFLLQDEAQENDLDKLHSKEAIREQLHKTFSKFTSFPIVLQQVYDVPLFPTLTDVAFDQLGFSKGEIELAKKKALENN
jgi:hypothetical protein